VKQKKIFLGFLILLSAGMLNKTYAQTVEVSALEAFSTANPPQNISVKLNMPLSITNEQILNSGVILTGSLADITDPKRLKRNASFKFKPKNYTDLDGTKHSIESDITASYTTTLDKGDLAGKAALTVGNHFVKGLSMGVAAVKGAVKNESGNRLKSSAESLYEASPVSYVEKGQELQFEENETFYLKFPNIKKQKK